jgi:superfamily II DNA or RNA helicase
VQALLSFPISATAQKCLNELDDLYQKKMREVPLYQLSRIFQLSYFMNYRAIELYQKEDSPEDVLGYLAWVKVALERHQLTLNTELSKIFQAIPLNQKQQQEIADLEVQHWQATFEKIAQNTLITKAAPTLRLKLFPDVALIEISHTDGESFRKASATKLRELCRDWSWHKIPQSDHASEIILRACFDGYNTARYFEFPVNDEKLPNLLARLISDPKVFAQHVVDETGQPMPLHEQPLQWKLGDVSASQRYSELSLQTAAGDTAPHIRLSVPGRRHYVWLETGFHPVTQWPQGLNIRELPLKIPTPALISSGGYALLKNLAVAIPAEISRHVITLTPQVRVKCSLAKTSGSASEYLCMIAQASIPQEKTAYRWNLDHWEMYSKSPTSLGSIVEIDESPLQQSAAWFGLLPFKISPYHRETRHELRATKTFPDQFLEWMRAKPEGTEVLLDPALSDLFNGVVSGNVSLEIEESEHGIDWFDIRVDVTISDTSLTKQEIELLLKAKGKWVKLSDKGWRKLEYNLSAETERELADIGLSAQEFDGETQRLHALQLGALAKKNSQLLPEQAQKQITRRIEEIQTRVTPALPAAIKATLRPYQTEGFHFLAYLSANHFGGVLADDMGLGKTIQALTWLAWLHETGKNTLPSLVVAPKSVQENWSQEATRFFPQLRTRTWKTGDIEERIDPASFDLLIINYAQLRNRSEALQAIAWLAVIVDEAQNIKNPSSQSTQVLRSLHANQRIALTGTPIENRLMDLWSIFSFAMPGALGSRASFAKTFDNPKDPFARRRLSARTRPFLLRRTKNEVAKDLPDRIEEDLTIELEGIQQKLYQAELKRARAHLLKARIPGQLDKLRFHLLSSLLRLRQICCHPQLVGLEETAESAPKKKTSKKTSTTEDSGTSAKLEALMELLEPLIEEGQKVLVFSQFVEMLAIIRAEIEKREWKQFLLTGQTDERGALVQDFQTTEGGAVFLISLKAGGAGLNLTAASYVVLFDPWWNPAVEAQAIDRTHRIGQKSTVIAYRLVVKDTIEQKIRELQKFKSAVAQDILGEENFARALTLDDFQFLLETE